MTLGHLITLKRRRMKMKKRTTKKAIAHRKNCSASGTGLSHYILIKEK